MSDDKGSELTPIKGYQLLAKANSCKEAEPELAVSFFKQSIDAYRRERDGQGELEATHWLMQTYNHFINHHQEAVEVGVRAVVMARKSEYKNVRIRICLHEDLISAYLGLDPEGYETQIREAIAYMEGEISPQLQCAFCLRHRIFGLELWLENFELAHRLSIDALAVAEGGFTGTWHRPAFLNSLCEVASLAPFGRESMADWGREAETTLKRQGRSRLYAASAMFQAAGHRFRGEEEESRRHYDRALGLRNSSESKAFYNAARAYHAAENDWEKVVGCCDEQLQELSHETAPALVARVHRWKCEALQRDGKLTPEVLEEARTAAKKLRPPNRELARLEKLVEGI